MPPGVDADRFERALAAFADVVGAPDVCRGGASLHPYLDPFVPLADPHAFAPSADLLPASVEEIRAILRIANETRMPLWTVSTGRNFAYGGAAPRLAGSVVGRVRGEGALPAAHARSGQKHRGRAGEPGTAFRCFVAAVPPRA